MIPKKPTGEPTGHAGQLEQMFNIVGTSMMSDEFAGQLLAYLYVCGGGNEAVVHHPGLNAGIQIAQQKANLYGGHIPNADIVALIQKYTKELELAIKLLKGSGASEQTELPKMVPWLQDIYNRYNLDPGGRGKKAKK